MENEIMVNEEVMENATEVVTTESGNGFKTLVGIGLTVLAGVVVYKVGKKVIAKVKAKKEQAKMIKANSEELNDEEIDSEEV